MLKISNGRIRVSAYPELTLTYPSRYLASRTQIVWWVLYLFANPLKLVNYAMCNLFIQNLTARGNGERGMGNGGFFDSLTIWRAQKERTSRQLDAIAAYWGRCAHWGWRNSLPKLKPTRKNERHRLP